VCEPFVKIQKMNTTTSGLALSRSLRYHDIEELAGRVKMAQFVVRNLENTVKARLQRRAKRHGRSMEEEVREILRNAVHEEDVPTGGLGTEIAALFAKMGIRSDIPELRGHEVRPAKFEP
jgi:plasmid stability protein